MEAVIGVEDARAKLGRIVEEVAAGSAPVVLTRRGRALAVVLSREEYAELKDLATRQARAELRRRLGRVRERVQAKGLRREAVNEAISSVRKR